MQDPSSALSPNSDRRRDSDESRLLNVKYKKKVHKRSSIKITYENTLTSLNERLGIILERGSRKKRNGGVNVSLSFVAVCNISG